MPILFILKSRHQVWKMPKRPIRPGRGAIRESLFRGLLVRVPASDYNSVPMKRALLLFLLFSLILTSCSSSNNSSASDSPANYIENKGSDTIVNLALAWAEKYQSDHPDVRISVTGGGSGTGIASLVNGTVDIANASRKIKDEEVAEAKSNGVEPVEHIIARDAIAVIVNPENPVNELTLQQISDIYSGKIFELAGSGRGRPSRLCAYRVKQIQARMFIFWKPFCVWEARKIKHYFQWIRYCFHRPRASFQKCAITRMPLVMTGLAMCRMI